MAWGLPVPGLHRKGGGPVQPAEAAVAGPLPRGDSRPPSTLPAAIATLDAVHAAFWRAWRHLFPPHSLAAQLGSGGMVISWSVADDPHAHHPYAAPVMLRFDADLLDAMQRADAGARVRIALAHEPTLREGLRGYDPFSRFPNARVVNIG